MNVCDGEKMRRGEKKKDGERAGRETGRWSLAER